MSTELQAVEQWLSGTALPYWLNIVTYGGVPNSPSTCNDTAIESAKTAAVIAGSPTRIIFPAGTWYTCTNHNLPVGVRFAGVGKWSQEPEFGTVVNTVLKAGSTFNVGSTLPGQFMFFLGGTGTDDYGSGIEDMSIDGSGIADGIYVGHVNEFTALNYVNILNYPHYGIFECGADNGGSCVIGGKSGESGAQGHGPYMNLLFSSNDAYGATAATVAIFLDNVTGLKGIDGVTIAPVTSSNTNIPTSSIVMWGIQTSIKHVHGQNSTSLLTLSPPSSPCPANCNGSLSDSFEELNLTNAPATNYVVNILGATNNNLTFVNINDTGGSGATCKINYNLANGYSGCITHEVSNFAIDGNGLPQSIEDGFIFQGTNVFGQGSMNYMQGTWTWKSPTGPTYGTTITAQADNGNFTISGTGTSQNILFNRGYFTYSWALNGVAAGTNVNLNVLGDTGSTGQRSSFCNDVFWDTVNQRWQVGSNGGGDWACLAFHNGFSGIATNSGYSPGATFSQATMNANMALITTDSGHTIVGKGSVNSGGSVSDNGTTLQVLGGISVTAAVQFQSTGSSGSTTPAYTANSPCASGTVKYMPAKDSGGSTIYLMYCQ
jgi:hypothetical protein